MGCDQVIGNLWFLHAYSPQRVFDPLFRAGGAEGEEGRGGSIWFWCAGGGGISEFGFLGIGGKCLWQNGSAQGAAVLFGAREEGWSRLFSLQQQDGDLRCVVAGGVVCLDPDALFVVSEHKVVSA